MPHLKKRLDYWKPLKLPILAKARVIEIFHASKLWYAATFYPIPTHLEKEINQSFINYIAFPKNKHDVSKMEMQKLRKNGGLKLINVKIKSEAPKIQWLIKLITDDNLRIHLKIFNDLVGIQKGNLSGNDVIFADYSFMKNTLKLNDSFYLEALNGISRLDVRKHILDIKKEPLFYNPIFTTAADEDSENTTIKPFAGNSILVKIKTYGDILEAENTITQPKLKAVIAKKKLTIHNIRDSVETNRVVGSNEQKEFRYITQKFIYEELLYKQSRDHPYQTKWFLERNEMGAPNWDRIWENIQNPFFTEETKSTVWDQIHLNFYTTYTYIKWHNNLQPCPLCNKIPEDIFHIILECKFTDKMWTKLEHTLLKIFPKGITTYEKAFGIQPTKKKDRNATILRNWLTFTLRHCIMLEERKAYFKKYTQQDEHKFILKYNYLIKEEAATKELQYKFQGKEEQFENIITVNNAITRRNEEAYVISNIM